MFSSQAYLDKKTGPEGINRQEFIAHLVEEYHTTTNVEAQEQVTANLANFAYDPINWSHLKQAQALRVFQETLEIPNERLQQHGMAGLCNICHDPQAYKFITNPQHFTRIAQLFQRTENADIIINFITLCYQILTTRTKVEGLGAATKAEVKQIIVTSALLKKLMTLRDHSNECRVKNLTTLFLQEFGTKCVVVEEAAYKMFKRHDEAAGK